MADLLAPCKAFPFARMAPSGKQRARYTTQIAQEVLKLILQRGSGDETDNTGVVDHDRDSDNKLFEAAKVKQKSDDDETFMVDCEDMASVPDNELSSKIRIFNSNSETDPAHRTGVKLQENRPIVDHKKNVRENVKPIGFVSVNLVIPRKGQGQCKQYKMVEVNDANKQIRNEKNLVEKFACNVQH